MGDLNHGHYVAYIKTSQRSSAYWYENMTKSWKDPEKCKVEVECKLEKRKNEASPSKIFKKSVIKQDEQMNDETKWYCISDAVVNACEKKEAITNENAYVLMYEKV